MVVGFIPITTFMCWDKLWVLFWPAGILSALYVIKFISYLQQVDNFITQNNKELRHGYVVHIHPNNLEKMPFQWEKKCIYKKKSYNSTKTKVTIVKIKLYSTFNNTEVVKKKLCENLYVSYTYNNMNCLKKRAATV